jgi:hypothetical protein
VSRHGEEIEIEVAILMLLKAVSRVGRTDGWTRRVAAGGQVALAPAKPTCGPGLRCFGTE